MDRAIITVGMGYGDEGKGATVDWLVRQHDAKLVVRYSGGHQAGHNVVLPDGLHHCFSQWGSGTFAGANTYLDRDVIVDPLAMVQEAKHLKSVGIDNPFSMMTVHPKCPVTTSYHRSVNRTLEKHREVENVKYAGTEGIHGSCGLGVGETRRLWRDGASIRASDLNNYSQLLDKIWRIRTVLRDYLLETWGITEDKFVDWPESPYMETNELYSASKGLLWSETPQGSLFSCIFEGAQGVLLDEVHGNFPHTTWSTVTQRNAVELLDAMGVPYDVYGITRAYATRHGAGPLESQFDWPKGDPNNPPNYQGEMRFGYLQPERLKQAVKIIQPCCLVVNHMDDANQWGFRMAAKEPCSENDFLRNMEDICECPVAVTSSGPTWEDRKCMMSSL